MKKSFGYLCSFVMLLILTGCPVGTPYPLGKVGTEKIDKGLLGEWRTEDVEAEVIAFKISKKDDHSYNVQVLEKGSSFSITSTDLTGWVTLLDGKKFFYAKPSDEEKYYLYCYELKGKEELVTFDVSLLVGGMDAVTSTEAFRQEVSASLKKPDCLVSEKNFKRAK